MIVCSVHGSGTHWGPSTCPVGKGVAEQSVSDSVVAPAHGAVQQCPPTRPFLCVVQLSAYS